MCMQLQKLSRFLCCFISSAAFCMHTQAQPVYTDSLQQALNEAKSDTTRIQLHLDLAYEFMYSDNPTAEMHAQEAVRIAEKLNQAGYLAEGYAALGTVFDYQGKALLAMQNYLKSIALFEQENNEKALGNMYFNVGALFVDRGEKQQAISYLKKGYALEMKQGDTLDALFSLLTLSGQMAETAQTDSTEKLYAELFSLVSASPNTALLANIQLNYGKFLVSKRIDPEKGKQFLDKAWLLARQEENSVLQMGACINISEYWIARLQGDSAIHYARMANQMAENSNQLLRRINSYMALSRAFEILPDIDSALYYYKKYDFLSDSISSVQKSEQLNEMELIYQTEENERKLLAKDAALAKSRNRMLIIGFTALLLLIICLFLFISFRNKSRNSKILEQKNQVIANTLNQRELLLREIHHRVKNNLQLVSSLLHLQSLQNKNSENQEVLREANQRVKSIALVHQKLYQHDDLSQIELSEYFRELVHALERTAGKPDTDHQIRIEVPHLHVDIDLVIPLALIVTEVCINSFKYGTSNSGVLHLSLQLKQHEAGWRLSIRDQGEAELESLPRTGFGYTLIEALVEKMEGKFTYIVRKGAIFTLDFPEIPNRPAKEN